MILSQGERLAVDILAAVLDDKGLNAEGLESDDIGIITDCVFENATVNIPLTKINLEKRI